MASADLRLMCVLAHPDDESLGTGGALAMYAAEGVACHLVTATRGERGRIGDKRGFTTPEVIGRLREAELRAAAATLGVREVSLLGYPDGALDQAPPDEAIGRIVGHLRRVRPQVVVTFGPEGAYGHPDHIAISQFTIAAVARAADADHADGAPAHRVDKLYCMAWSRTTWELFQAALREITMTVDGVVRRVAPWPDWAITTRLPAEPHWEPVWRAVMCHQTQMAMYAGFTSLSAEQHRALWGRQGYYRVFSLVNGGREPETDLFAGLR